MNFKMCPKEKYVGVPANKQYTGGSLNILTNPIQRHNFLTRIWILPNILFYTISSEILFWEGMPNFAIYEYFYLISVGKQTKLFIISLSYAIQRF